MTHSKAEHSTEDFGEFKPETKPSKLHILLLLLPAGVAIALFLGISSYQQLAEVTDAETGNQAIDFDAYAEGIDSVLYDLQGNVEYTLQAERQRHYKNDVTELEQPFIQLYERGQPDWNIAANQGRILANDKRNTANIALDSGMTNSDPQRPAATTSMDSRQDIDTIELTGAVAVYSIDEYNNRTILNTEFLILDPDTETMATDLPVQLESESLTQTALGMFADLKADEMYFHQRLQGQYQVSNTAAMDPNSVRDDVN